MVWIVTKRPLTANYALGKVRKIVYKNSIHTKFKLVDCTFFYKCCASRKTMRNEQLFSKIRKMCLASFRRLFKRYI